MRAPRRLLVLSGVIAALLAVPAIPRLSCADINLPHLPSRLEFVFATTPDLGIAQRRRSCYVNANVNQSNRRTEATFRRLIRRKEPP
jgi:hypothetical protein